ncbi:MAG: CvpA family protein [Parvularculaceae bacterium]
MTWFDLAVIALLGFSLFFAWIRGLSRELSTLASLGAGALVALLLATPLGKIVGAGSDMIVRLGIMALAFVVTFMLASVVIDMGLSKYLGNKPSTIDRWLGGLFGFLRGFVLIGLFYLFIGYSYDDSRMPPAIKNAATLDFARSAADFLGNFGITTEPREPDAAP